MNTSYFFSSSTRTLVGGTDASFMLHGSHLYRSSRTSPSLYHDTHFSKREEKSSKLNPRRPNSSLLPVIKVRSLKPLIPFPMLSSFAEVEDEEHQLVIDSNQEDEEAKSDDSSGMAQAFNISSSTAAISICMALATFCLPFVMKSLGQGLGLKNKLLSYTTLLFRFYMAWNIGANDVANAMGTLVGSGALTLRQAVLTAGVLEFLGAIHCSSLGCFLPWQLPVPK